MSYWVHLAMPACRPALPFRYLEYDADRNGILEPASEVGVYDVGNYTSNVNDMWQTALGCPFSDLNGQRAGSAVELLSSALIDMEARPDVYREKNPPNGWGFLRGSHGFLSSLL